ncbi:MAG: sulfotransferase [Patescibacteria group bacterium]|nr:sulfotransferase [Patescibacteria group bacterium]
MKSKLNNKIKLNFIGIGAQRSGTTWLAEKLDQHPKICISVPKEICYFNKKRSYIHNSMNENYKKSFNWYRKRFAHCKTNQKQGEFSTIYLFDKYAPRNIYKHFPNIKIIICLRNPINRAYSQYRVYNKYYKVEERSFEKVVRVEEEYRERGLYYKQLTRYLKYFNKSQMHIILFKKIKNEPDKTIKDVYQFLEVDGSFEPEGLEKRTNASKSVKTTSIPRLMGIFSELLISLNLSWLIRLLKNIGIKKFIMQFITKRRKHQKIDTQTENYLKNFYQEDIENLEKLLNKDLSHWKC